MNKNWWYEKTNGYWKNWKLWKWLAIILGLFFLFLIFIWLVVPQVIYFLGYLIAFAGLLILVIQIIRIFIREFKWWQKKAKQTKPYLGVGVYRKK
jgi:protein-S-isoprenylcysteine O-methyltransferase Ste14